MKTSSGTDESLASHGACSFNTLLTNFRKFDARSDFENAKDSDRSLCSIKCAESPKFQSGAIIRTIQRF